MGEARNGTQPHDPTPLKGPVLDRARRVVVMPINIRNGIGGVQQIPAPMPFNTVKEWFAMILQAEIEDARAAAVPAAPPTPPSSIWTPGMPL